MKKNYTRDFFLLFADNKLKLILLTIALLAANHANAQDCNKIGFDKKSVKKLINQQFGNLITPDSKTGIGNSATLDLKEAAVNFNGNIIFKNGSILAIKAKGAVSDGLLPVFTNNELNTDFGIEVQYNILNLKKAIQYDNQECEKYYATLRKINNEYEIKRVEVFKEVQRNSLQLEIEKHSKKISSLDEKITASSGLKKDSLTVEIEKLKLNLSYKQEQINFLPTIESQIFELENWKDDQERRALESIKLLGFEGGWLSFGYGLSNSEFRLYNQALPLADQVAVKTYDTHKFNVQYSYYRNSSIPYDSYFITAGLRYALEDNLYLLDKVEISENSVSGTPPVTRSKTAKFTAHEGEYINDINSISIYSDFYWFLFEGNQAALHFYPEQKIMDNLKPATNLGFGILLAFKDKEKTENRVNAEIYINFLDLANNINSENDLFERSSYGLRFTFPINFNLKN